MNLLEDIVARHRLIGVLVWFLVLMLFVPHWYANPVNFSPEKLHKEHKLKPEDKVLFSEPYRLPAKANSLQQIAEAQEDAKAIAIQDQELKQKNLQSPKAQVASDQQQKKALNDTVSSERPARSHSDNPESVEMQSKSSGPSWLVRLGSFSNIKEANDFLAEIEKYGFDVRIKAFRRNTVFSVRVVGFDSERKAEKAKQKLDKIFNLKDSSVHKTL